MTLPANELPPWCNEENTLKDNVYAMQKQLERTAKALRFAAGIISTYPPHDEQHPLDVYEWLLKEADYDNGG